VLIIPRFFTSGPVRHLMAAVDRRRAAVYRGAREAMAMRLTARHTEAEDMALDGALSAMARPRAHAPRRRRRNCVAEARRLVLQQKCLELRLQGLSERAIAEQLVKDRVVAKISRGYVNQLLVRALDRIVVPEAERFKKLELERLDGIINGHYGNAINGDVAATHALLACIDRRTRLLGIGREQKVSSQTLGADGNPVDPIRPVINLTIARPAVEVNGANGKLIDQSAQPLLSNGRAESGIND
jgi:hypothetical protein